MSQRLAPGSYELSAPDGTTATMFESKKGSSCPDCKRLIFRGAWVLGIYPGQKGNSDWHVMCFDCAQSSDFEPE